MCCEPSGYKHSEINGECPKCEEPIVDGDAFEQCSYSPVECDACGWQPCDQSC
jgi:hypothetical protein